jgi:hypothetical protein
VIVAFASALLGGAISFLTSFLLARSERSHSEKVRRSERLEARAYEAHSGLVKILQLANGLYSLDKAIQAEFDRAAAEPDPIQDPAMIVQEIPMGSHSIEALKADELAFLLHSPDANLLQELIVFEARARNHERIFLEYNDRRKDLTSIVESGLTEVNGAAMRSELSGRDAMRAEVRVAALNQLLATEITLLERDVQEAKQLIDRFAIAARKEFGNLFPNLKMESQV